MQGREAKAGPNGCFYVPPKDFKPIECKAVVGDRPFFVPWNATKETIINTARQGAYGLSLQSTKCRDAAVRFVCLSAFRPCATTRYSSSLPNFLVLPLPAPPCRSDCEAFVRACSKEMEDGIISPVDCSAMASISGTPFDSAYPLYPNSSVSLSLNNGAIQTTIPCRDARHEELPDPEECPPPTRLNSKYDKYPKCAPPCKIFFTDTQQEALVITNIVLCAASLFIGLILLIGFSRVPEFRTFPAQLIPAVVVVMMIRALITMIVSAVKGTDLVCHNEFEVAGTTDAACAASGTAAGLTGYIAVGYCCMLFWSIASSIVFGVQPRRIAKLCIPAHILAWGVPIISYIVALSAGAIQGSPGIIFACGLTFDDGYFWGVLFSGTMFYLFSGFIASIIVIRSMLATERKSQMGRNLAFFLFVIILFVITGFSMAFGLYSFSQLDNFRNSVRAYVRCSATTRFLDPKAFHRCGMEYSPNFALTVAFLVFYQAGIVWLAVGISFHRKLRRAWLVLLCLAEHSSGGHITPSGSRVRITNTGNKASKSDNSDSLGASHSHSAHGGLDE